MKSKSDRFETDLCDRQYPLMEWNEIMNSGRIDRFLLFRKWGKFGEHSPKMAFCAFKDVPVEVLSKLVAMYHGIRTVAIRRNLQYISAPSEIILDQSVKLLHRFTAEKDFAVLRETLFGWRGLTNQKLY